MSTGPTLADVLADARRHGVDRLDAQLLLCALLDRPRSWLLAHDDTRLAPEQAAHTGMSYDDLVRWMVEDASCDR